MNSKTSARQDGLYVPGGILETVESDFKARKAKAGEKWLRKLDKDFPNIPSTDRAKIHRRYFSPSRRTIDNTFPSMWRDNLPASLWRYILHRYTAFTSLRRRNANQQEISATHGKADKILSAWSATKSSTDKRDQGEERRVQSSPQCLIRYIRI